MSDHDTTSRTDFLKQIIAVPAAAAAIAASATAADAAKSSKSALKYVDKSPNSGQQCQGCTLFIAGKTATAKGQCKVVAGAISPGGYCIAYSAKKAK